MREFFESTNCLFTNCAGIRPMSNVIIQQPLNISFIFTESTFPPSVHMKVHDDDDGKQPTVSGTFPSIGYYGHWPVYGSVLAHLWNRLKSVGKEE